MSIMRRAAAVFARLITLGRHEEAKVLQTAVIARKRKPRGRKYPPAVQVRGGLCTIGSHDAAIGLALRYKQFATFGRAKLFARGHEHYQKNRRARDSSVYKEKLAELGVRQS